MNNLDEDGEIHGNIPFYDGKIPSAKSSTKYIVAFVLKCVLMLVILAGLIYGIIFVYRKFSGKQTKVKPNKASKSEPGFSVFTNESENGKSSKRSKGDTESQSKESIFNLGSLRAPTPPPKKTFG